MKRAPVVLSATVAGLAAALGFHAHVPAAVPVGAAQVTPSSPSGTASTPATPASGASARTITSEVATNRYGNVQLMVTITGGKITSIDALQIPENDGKSAQINAYAEPLLRQSALSAQSASIDAVSGATYTSDSYRTALQSVLDQARPPSDRRHERQRRLTPM